MLAAVPLGIRNNNPGNIRYNQSSKQFLGCTGENTSFCVFDTAEHGIRAIAKILLIYQDVHKLYTIQKIIERWSATDRLAYVKNVCLWTGYTPNTSISMHSPQTLLLVVKAIIRQENGEMLYAEDVINSSLKDALQGVLPHEEIHVAAYTANKPHLGRRLSDRTNS